MGDCADDLEIHRAMLSKCPARVKHGHQPQSRTIIEPPRRQGAKKFKNNDLAAKAAKHAKEYKIDGTADYRIVTGKGISR
jgi:hypothetical protein